MKRLAWLLLPLGPAACAAASPADAADPAASAAAALSASAGASTPGTPSASAAPEGPPPVEAFPVVSGTHNGKPWELKGAGTVGPVQKDGTVLVGLGNYVIDCGAHEAS